MNTFIAHKEENGKLFFNAEESWHCAKVLRMKSGEEVRVIDGRGNAWNAKLATVNEKECVAEISEVLTSQLNEYFLHIAIAPTKNMDRIEWFAEKATELGVGRITFIICKNSERKIIKSDRIKKIVESAVKQSIRSVIPLVDEALSFRSFIEQFRNEDSENLIAHCVDGSKNLLQQSINKKQKKYLLLIGPEGDFSPDEIELALQNKFVAVSLGESRLRTETAGVYGAAVLRSIFAS